MPFARFLLCSPPRCLTKMVASPAAAITSMAMNPASKFPKGDGEDDESHEGHAYGHRRQCEEAAADAHEFQRLLESLEHGETVLTVLVLFHGLT